MLSSIYLKIVSSSPASLFKKKHKVVKVTSSLDDECNHVYQICSLAQLGVCFYSVNSQLHVYLKIPVIFSRNIKNMRFCSIW